VVATPRLAEAVDANGFDPATQLAFASNGDGTLTVVHEDSPDKFTVVENVPTKKSSRTMALDLKDPQHLSPAADFDPPASRRTPRQDEARLVSSFSSSANSQNSPARHESAADKKQKRPGEEGHRTLSVWGLRELLVHNAYVMRAGNE